MTHDPSLEERQPVEQQPTTEQQEVEPSQPSDEDAFAAVVERLDKAGGDAKKALRTKPEPEPAQKPLDNRKAKTDNGGAAPDTDDEPFHGFNALPDEAKRRFLELREGYSKLQQNYRAQQNQLTPVQRQAAKLLAEKQALEKQIQALKTQQAPATKPVPEKWKRHATEFPEDAEAFEERLAAERAELESKLNPLLESVAALSKKLDESSTRVAESEERAFKREQRSAVDSWAAERGIDWIETMRSPEFKAWADAELEPEELERIGPNGFDARWYVRYLSRFQADIGRAESVNAATAAASAQKRRVQEALDVDPNPAARHGPTQVKAPADPEEERFAEVLRKHGHKID